jgi:nucleoside-diphosphate-sugar epimerase
MILVTGASGLVGGALLRLLSQDGIPALAALRSAQPLPPGVEPRQAPALGPDADWREALAGANAVVHAAALAHSIGDTRADQLALYRRVNGEGALTLARQAAQAGVKRFVFVSTIKVMGEESPPGRAFTSADAPQPFDVYAISKWEAEQGLAAIARETGMEVAILRPPLVYGPGVKANMRSLIRLVQSGIPLPLGAIANRRSLVGADNLAGALKLLALDPRASGGTFFIKDTDLSTPDLIRAIAKALGRPPRLLPVPDWLIRWGTRLIGRPGIADRLLSSLVADDGPLRQGLGWNPLITLDEGLRRMVAPVPRSQDL